MKQVEIAKMAFILHKCKYLTSIYKTNKLIHQPQGGSGIIGIIFLQH